MLIEIRFEHTKFDWFSNIEYHSDAFPPRS